MVVDVTTASGRRPVVVLCGPMPGLAERLARAGFAVVAFDPQTPPGIEVVLDALARGVLGVDADSCALVEPRDDGSVAVTRAAAGTRMPGMVLRDVTAVVPWLAKHLV